MSDPAPPYARSGSVRKIVGDEARALIERELAAHGGGVLTLLAQYKLADAVQAWHATIRAIEEFINLPLFEIKDAQLEAWLRAAPLDERFLANPGAAFSNIQKALSPLFDVDVVQRFCRTMLQAAAIASAFKTHGQSNFGQGRALDTVGGAIDYFQSRRRHFVSLLYTMPSACKGTAVLDPLDTLNVLLPLVEHSCITITGLHQKLVLIELVADYSLEVDDVGALGSHEFQTLEGYFLDAERASIQVMSELRRNQIVRPKMEPVDPRKVFSAAELRNSVKLIAATYAAFDLNDSDFSVMALLVIAFSRQCHDDYTVVIRKQKLLSMLQAQGRMDPEELERLLINKSADYATNTNAYEPFIDLGEVVVSNVNLLSRFLYAFKNVHLGSRKRFQIHAGFIFEDMVKRDLEAMGFVLSGIKRINRKEFDVVATLGGVIYNFQCKNNWIDLAKVESDRALFVRYNRSLIGYYKRALARERKREGLLLAKLGLSRIEHYVISRFPVIGTHPRIICYNMIDQLRALTNGTA